MKFLNNSFFLISIFFFNISVSFSQQTIFNNGSGDNLWSTESNWSLGVPNSSNAVAVIKSDIIIVDGNFQVAQLKLPSLNQGGLKDVTLTNSNEGRLTITGQGVNQPVQMNRNGQNLIFNLPVIFDSNENIIGNWRFNSGNQSMTFAKEYSLIINDDIEFTAINTTSEIHFNGKILGEGNLIFGAKSDAFFGPFFDGYQFEGKIIIEGGNTSNDNVTLTANLLDDGTFLKEAVGKIIVNESGSTININGTNILKGNIIITSTHNLNLNINKNQSSVGTLSIGSGTLSIVVDNSVSSISFADNSGADWGSGSIEIFGVSQKELRFGLNSYGLSNDQLNQILVDGDSVFLDSDGFLGITIKDKKGSAINYSTPQWSKKVKSVNPFWHYSWNKDLKDERPSNIEYVPMFWGKGGVTDSEIFRIKELADSGLIKNVLTFNEPDLMSQSNLSVDEVISLWHKFEEIGVPLGSPAVAGINNGWLDEFMAKAEENNLRVDFICLHLYKRNDPQLFLDDIDYIYQTYNKPIWITEMSVVDFNATSIEDNQYTPEQILENLKVLLPELYKRDFLKRFTWFSGTENSPNYPRLVSSVLYDSSGELTILGEYYSSFKPNPLLIDSDGDGVTDDLDECPDTPSGLTVDATGCSDSQKDSDGDGVTDDLDKCPDTPSGLTVDATGCSDPLNFENISSVEKVYPNPISSNRLNVVLKNIDEVENLYFISSNGNRYDPINIQQNGRNLIINISNIKGGIYFLRIYTKNELLGVRVRILK